MSKPTNNTKPNPPAKQAKASQSPNDTSSPTLPTAPVNSSKTAQPPRPSDSETKAAFGAAPLLGDIDNPIILTSGQKIQVICDSEKHKSDLYNSMSPAHREACQLVMRPTQKESPSESSYQNVKL